MPEAEAPLGARVVLGLHLRLEIVVIVRNLDGDRLVELVLEVLVVAVQAVAVLLVALVAGDQLGEHPRERVDLVASQLGAGREAGRMVGDDALEAEHERVVNLPRGGRRLEPGFHLREGVVERLAARMPFAEHLGRVFVLPQEGLAGP